VGRLKSSSISAKLRSSCNAACIQVLAMSSNTCAFRKFHPAWESPRRVESSHERGRCSRSYIRSQCSDFFRSPRRLEAENLFLRHQLSIALRRAPRPLRLRGSDRGARR
jgi:hypothetical protein